MNNEYQILSFYIYKHINNPREYRNEHHKICLKYNLLGRLIISAEGLNGTLSGLKIDCQNYVNELKSDVRFKNIEIKVDNNDAHVFEKLNVRCKSEIVNSGLTNIDPNVNKGKYIEAQNLDKIIETEDVVLIDVRSKYEHRQGAFKNAIVFEIDNFREFPTKINELEKFKKKKIITYCTGGIKCEKASSFLLKKGFENVHQLHGGIIDYKQKTSGKNFDGECYVFDKRISVPVNKLNPTIKNKCVICNCFSSRIVNCANPKCNIHTALCQTCGSNYNGACSQKCKESPEIRKYDGSGYYVKKKNGYNPYKNSLR